MSTAYAPLKDEGPSEELLSEEPPAFVAETAPQAAVESSFVHGPRKAQDRRWGFYFAGYVTVVTFLGLIFLNSANPDFFKLTHTEFLQNYDTCHVPATNGRRALAEFSDLAERENSRVRSAAGAAIILSGFGAVALGLLFILLMKHNAPAMVRATMTVQLLFPLVIGSALLGQGAVGGGLFWILIGALWAWVLHLWRPQLHLVGQLLGVAAHALNDNKHLITATVGINAVTGAAVLPLAVNFGFAYANGDVQPSPWAVRSAPDSQACVDSDHNPANCCVWMPHGGAILYMAFASLAMSWIVFLAFEVRLFTVSHVVGRWFYLPIGQKLQGWPVWEGMKTAMGPSFGTLALGSAVLTAADAMRQAAQQSRDNARGNGLVQCIACVCSAVAQCIAELISQLTKFATVRAALTGEAFFDAARSVTDLLARNFLDSYAVWRFPQMVLGFAMFICSAMFGLLVYLCFSLSVGTPVTTTALQLASQLSAAVGVGAAVLALVALSLMSTIILNVVDCVYICYALDRDRHAVTRQEVHDIFVLIPQPAFPAQGVPAAAQAQQQQPAVGYVASGVPPTQQQQFYSAA